MKLPKKIFHARRILTFTEGGIKDLIELQKAALGRKLVWRVVN